ncbi:MAG: hypothetical protein AAF602_03690 [Myxococcota bacterium]
MRNALLLTSIAALGSACIVTPVTPGRPGGGGGVIFNAPAGFDAVFAEISLGVAPRDDLLLLDAEVFDPDGIGDVAVVFVEIYDDYTGFFVDSFDLIPQTSFLWQETIPVFQTNLDPYYYPDYSIDFVVQDFQGEGEIVNVLPDIY